MFICHLSESGEKIDISFISVRPVQSLCQGIFSLTWQSKTDIQQLSSCPLYTTTACSPSMRPAIVCQEIPQMPTPC